MRKYYWLPALFLLLWLILEPLILIVIFSITLMVAAMSTTDLPSIQTFPFSDKILLAGLIIRNCLSFTAILFALKDYQKNRMTSFNKKLSLSVLICSIILIFLLFMALPQIFSYFIPLCIFSTYASLASFAYCTALIHPNSKSVSLIRTWASYFLIFTIILVIAIILFRAYIKTV